MNKDPLKTALEFAVEKFPYYKWEYEQSKLQQVVVVRCIATLYDKDKMEFSKVEQTMSIAGSVIGLVGPAAEKTLIRGINQCGLALSHEIKKQGYGSFEPVFMKGK